MQTCDKIEEARDILAAMLVRKRGPATLVRALHLVESALAAFFDSPDDEAVLTDDDDIWIATEEPPFPEAKGRN